MPSHLDNKLKEALTQFETPLEEADWSDMSGKLDARAKAVALRPLRIAMLLLAGAAVAATTTWIITSKPFATSAHTAPSVQTTDHTSERTPVVPDEHVDEFIEEVNQPASAVPDPEPTMLATPRSQLASKHIEQPSRVGMMTTAAGNAVPLVNDERLSRTTPDAIPQAESAMPAIVEAEALLFAPVWTVEDSAHEKTWVLGIEQRAMVSFSSRVAIGHGFSATISKKLSDNWQVSLGASLMGYSHRRPKSKFKSEGIINANPVTVSKIRMQVAEFGFRAEFSPPLSNTCVHPFVGVGTHMFLPLKEQYEYWAPQDSNGPTLNHNYSILAADQQVEAFSTGTLGSTYRPQPSLGIVSASLGADFELRKNLSLRTAIEAFIPVAPFGIHGHHITVESLSLGLRWAAF